MTAPLHEILEFPHALPADLCRSIIERFEEDERKSKHDHPMENREAEILCISNLKGWGNIEELVTKNLIKVVQEVEKMYEVDFPPLMTSSYEVVGYEIGQVCKGHWDGIVMAGTTRAMTLQFYLNDVAEGGETEFPRQGIKVKPEEGKAAVFPPNFTHKHHVNPPMSNKRYVLTTWILYKPS